MSTNQLTLESRTVPISGHHHLIVLFFFSALCPMAWQYFSASCYWKFPIRRSWNEAREECARFRADLVVIDSDKEFDYIAKNVSDLREDFYVGFHYVNSKLNKENVKMKRKIRLLFRLMVMDQQSSTFRLYLLH